MAKARSLAPEQLRALGRIAKLPGIDRFYLAGASAITWHLGHRRSRDLDLFSIDLNVSLERLQWATRRERGVQVIEATESAVALKVGSIPVDLVRYPYPPLETPAPGPLEFPVAGLRDLAAMKLAAIARRGLRRDFWDLYELAHAGVPIREAAYCYVQRFGTTAADVYHVQRALTWFEDAERDPRAVAGLSAKRWDRIKTFFRAETPSLLDDV
ncbi:MAG: nucleotidyl transferase AbiEii/AbiGii toxin family protein [Deltaproteobacteria bacterium]|nr:nucleotidyl transferase AbiEii/AbiGii toxin family protein [Deltaproteobacteria bacterium]